MKANQVVSLNSNGILRLYNASRPSLIAEINLEIGELENYKFTYTIGTDVRVIVLGYKQNLQWWIYYIKVMINYFEIAAKFTEPGELIDISINFSGI